MCKRFLCSIVMVTSAVLTGPCFADHVIDTYPFWDGNVTNGWFAIAQSFVVPEDHSVLDNYMFGFSGNGVAIDFEIFQWDEATGPVGAALYSVGLVAGAGDVLIDDINLSLTPGMMYAAIVDLGDYSESSVNWMLNVDGNPDGDASWFDGDSWNFLNSGWSTQFRAEFVVPAPGALAAFGLFGLVGSRRRRSA